MTDYITMSLQGWQHSTLIEHLNKQLRGTNNTSLSEWANQRPTSSQHWFPHNIYTNIIKNYIHYIKLRPINDR